MPLVCAVRGDFGIGRTLVRDRMSKCYAPVAHLATSTAHAPAFCGETYLSYRVRHVFRQFHIGTRYVCTSRHLRVRYFCGILYFLVSSCAERGTVHAFRVFARTFCAHPALERNVLHDKLIYALLARGDAYCDGIFCIFKRRSDASRIKSNGILPRFFIRY